MTTFLEAIPGSADLVMTLVDAPSPISARATLEIIATAPAIVSTYLSIFLSARYDVLLTTGGFAGFPLILHPVPLFWHEHRALVADENRAVGLAADGAHRDDPLGRTRLRLALRQHLALGVDRVAD